MPATCNPKRSTYDLLRFSVRRNEARNQLLVFAQVFLTTEG
jgi:hypothetical protein